MAHLFLKYIGPIIFSPPPSLNSPEFASHYCRSANPFATLKTINGGVLVTSLKKIAITLGSLLSLSQITYANSSIGYEYGIANYSPDGGSSYSFGVHKFSIFDTTGGFNAAMRGAMNKNASQQVAEANAQKTMGESHFTTYQYSWNQPAPVPTDGELFVLTLGSEGNPIIDPISPSTTDGNPKQSVLGFEYSSNLWSKEMAPVSVGVNWGFKGFMFSAGKTTQSTVSIPVELIASSLVYEKTVAYGSFAVGPYGYATSNNAKYSHIEVGANYDHSQNLRFSLSYRSTQDQYKKGQVISSINNTTMSAGLKYQF